MTDLHPSHALNRERKAAMIAVCMIRAGDIGPDFAERIPQVVRDGIARASSQSAPVSPECWARVVELLRAAEQAVSSQAVSV